MDKIEIKVTVCLDYGYFLESKEITITHEEIEALAISKLKNCNSGESSNRGNWYAQCNGYCLGAIVDYNSRETRTVEINTYFNYRKSA